MMPPGMGHGGIGAARSARLRLPDGHEDARARRDQTKAGWRSPKRNRHPVLRRRSPAAGEHQLWDRDWTETANRAAAELFGRITRVPLLCRLERDYRRGRLCPVFQSRVLAQFRRCRKGYPGNARYIVLASLDGWPPITGPVNHGQRPVP